MPIIEHNAEIDATPEEIFEVLRSDDYFSRLAGYLEGVSSVELVELEALGSGKLRRVVRFTAPTRLPRFLRRFADRAPDEVDWDEIATIDAGEHRMSFEIIPEMPAHWHERYDTSGSLQVTPIGRGRSRVEQVLEYEIDAPRGFGTFIKRALKSEVTAIFEAKARLLSDHFDGVQSR